MDFSLRYDKREKSTHRFEIADHGTRRQLTIPVSRPEGAFLKGNLTWGDILVSAHGRWWETIPVALESAYGRSPFFQYYYPSFEELFVEPGPDSKLEWLVTRADEIVRSILGLDGTFFPDGGVITEVDEPRVRPYWQISGQEFTDGLSILDLIFNQGPEAPLYLRGL